MQLGAGFRCALYKWDTCLARKTLRAVESSGNLDVAEKAWAPGLASMQPADMRARRRACVQSIPGDYGVGHSAARILSLNGHCTVYARSGRAAGGVNRTNVFTDDLMASTEGPVAAELTGESRVERL